MTAAAVATSFVHFLSVSSSIDTDTVTCSLLQNTKLSVIWNWRLLDGHGNGLIYYAINGPDRQWVSSPAEPGSEGIGAGQVKPIGVGQRRPT